MTSTVQSRNPFSYNLGHPKFIPSGSVDIQIARMPWQTPVQKPGIITEVLITNPVGTAGRIALWDQDLSNTTPPTAGSPGAAIYTLEFGASAASGVASKTTAYSKEQLPEVPFIGGIAAQSTQPGVSVTVEVEYI